MSKETIYQTRGTCSRSIVVAVDDEGRISKCQFEGGCQGNTTGISQLVLGMKPEEVIQKLDGIRCGMKPTSCPDQLCRSLEQLLAEDS